jgi:hypothetical protein
MSREGASVLNFVLREEKAIECEAFGDPKPRLSWYKETKVAGESGWKVLISILYSANKLT